MKYLTKLVLLSVSTLIGGGAACGDDDGGGGGGAAPIDTGLPDSTELQDVTTEQFDQICDSLRDGLDRRFSEERTTRLFCEILGAQLTDDPSGCRDFAEECADQGGEDAAEALSISDQFECGSVDMLEGCGVTIGEYETCLNDALNAFDAYFSSVGCANAASAETLDLDDSLAGVERPASCTALESACPGVGL